MNALKSFFGFGKKPVNANYKANTRVVNTFVKNNNTKKNNNRSPVVWNGKVLPPATPAGQKSNINSNWKPAGAQSRRRKTRKNRK